MNSDNDLDERLFLRAVLAAPDDTADLLVAADWLQERSEPAAELIRLCVRLAGEGPEQRRGELVSRVRLLTGQVLGRDVDDRLDLLPVAVGLPRGRRKTGDQYRLVGRAVQTRPGRGPWSPFEGDLPAEVARQFLVLLAREWSRPASESISPFYGDRRGRDRMIRGRLRLANEHADQLHAEARTGFWGTTRELGRPRVAWFRERWLPDAEQVVALAERIASTGHQAAPGEATASLRSLGWSLSRLARGEEAGLHDGPLMQAAAGLFDRLAEALSRMGAEPPERMH